MENWLVIGIVYKKTWLGDLDLYILVKALLEQFVVIGSYDLVSAQKATISENNILLREGRVSWAPGFLANTLRENKIKTKLCERSKNTKTWMAKLGVGSYTLY